MNTDKYKILVHTAKQISILKILEYFGWPVMDGNIIQCPSTDHEDNHPSALLNKRNQIFCPVCQKNFDTIDTYRNLERKINNRNVPFIDACYKIAYFQDNLDLPSSLEDTSPPTLDDLLIVSDCEERVTKFLKLSHNLTIEDFKYLNRRGLVLKGPLRNAMIQNGVTLRSLFYGNGWCTSFYFSYDEDDFVPEGQMDFFFCRKREGDGKYNIGTVGVKMFYRHLDYDIFFLHDSSIFIVEGIFDAMTVLNSFPDCAVLCLNSCMNAKKAMEIIDCSTFKYSNCILAFDNDDMGKKTTEQFLTFMQEKKFRFYKVFSEYGDCKDLNELYLHIGKEQFRTLLTKYMQKR